MQGDGGLGLVTETLAAERGDPQALQDALDDAREVIQVE